MQDYPNEPYGEDQTDPTDRTDRADETVEDPAEAAGERPGCGWSLLLGLMGMAALLIFGLWAAREINRRNIAQPLAGSYRMLPEDQPKPQGPEQELKIYFIAGGQFLSAQPRTSRDTPDEAGRIHQIAHELANPPGSGLMETPLLGGAPKGIYILGGIVYVDLNRDFLQPPNPSPTLERLTIYSIVNSFVLNVPDIKGVQILVDGQVLRSAWGWMDISTPLGPDLSLVR